MEESLKARRTQLLVDADLQGTLLRRVAIYWLGAIALYSGAVILTKLLWGESFGASFMRESARLILPAAVISLLPLPLVLRDLLQVTHRYAGPMLRIRRGLAELAHTGSSTPIVPRSGDAWPECVADFNSLAKAMEEGRA